MDFCVLVCTETFRMASLCLGWQSAPVTKATVRLQHGLWQDNTGQMQVDIVASTLFDELNKLHHPDLSSACSILAKAQAQLASVF